MKSSVLRKVLCKFLIGVLLLLGMMVFSAVAEGALSLVTGLLLPRQASQPQQAPAARAARPARKPRPVPLRVVHGSRAA